MTDDLSVMARLAEYVTDLIVAKSYEEKARRERVAVEEKIAALIPTEVPGQRTVTISREHKLVVRREFSYKADIEGIKQVMVSLADPSLPPPIKTKTTIELDVDGYNWYREHLPGLFSKLSGHVEITPRKVSVTLK